MTSEGLVVISPRDSSPMLHNCQTDHCKEMDLMSSAVVTLYSNHLAIAPNVILYVAMMCSSRTGAGGWRDSR